MADALGFRLWALGQPKSFDAFAAYDQKQEMPEARSRKAGAKSIKLLLFDLGGVLVDWAGPSELGQYLRTPSTPAEILKRWVDCPHTGEFERGALASQEWAERFVRDWGVTLEPEEFLKVFRMMTRRVLPGARELLDALRPRFRVAALSNSNQLHWERNTNELKVLELFEFAIASHEVRLCKPDPAIYKLAIERSGVPADAIMFFDDLPVNVEAACALGMHGRQVKGVEGIRTSLIKDGIL
jgi:epoxide hydrolase-like predicted phosphatase